MLFLDNLNKIKQAKNNQMMGKQGQMYRKQNRDIDMISQASYPTIDIDASFQAYDQTSRREEYHSDSGFESLEPVYEEEDENEVLLNVSPNKFEKQKDQLYMDFFAKYTKMFIDEQEKIKSQNRKNNGRLNLQAAQDQYDYSPR